MSFLGKIFGVGGASTAVGAAQGVANIIDQFVHTKEEKAAGELLKMKLMMEPDKLQVELNKIEAAHRSIFIAGWRPFIGWVCGFGLAWHFLLYDLLNWTALQLGSKVKPPELTGTEELISIVMALLGLGAMRTYEKLHGKAK
jgi:hypothetical protein